MALDKGIEDSAGGHMETFSERLEAARRRRVLTQLELAGKAGVSLITITRLENDKGEANPRPDTVRKLAGALEVEPAWLLFGDQSEVKLAA
jgi:transcriptional regulator with XRE-family HTH domain